MLSFRVSLALRLKAFPLNHKLPRPQLLRITPTRNPSQISNLHTLQHHVSASHAQSIACALFQKHRGYTPKRLLKNFFSGASQIFSRSQRPKQEMPQRIHQRMHNRRREHRPRRAPCPPIKQPRDRRQNHIPPIRKPHVRNVREPKQNRSQYPSDVFVLRSPLQHVLQQPAKQKLLRPRREAKDRQRQERQRLPLSPTRAERYKMHCGSEGNRNRRKSQKASEDIQRPSRPPIDVVSRSRELPHQQKCRDRNSHAKQHREHVRQSPTRKRPEPMRRREFHRSPNARNGDVILPGSWSRPPRSRSQCKRHKDQRENRRDTCQPKGIGTERIDQVSKIGSAAQKISGSRAETRLNKLKDAARGKQDICGEVDGKRDEGRCEGSATVSQRCGVEYSGQRQRRPHGERSNRTDLVFRRQERIVSQAAQQSLRVGGMGLIVKAALECRAPYGRDRWSVEKKRG